MIGEILTRWGSDKDKDHSYGPVYDELFLPIKDSVKALLEIGIAWGPSLRAWEEIFPTARIVGLDIASDLINEGRIESYRCDSTELTDLKSVLGDSTFDIIIDDGCHWETEQVQTFENLRARLNPGGIYVIEDIQSLGAMEHFKQLGLEVMDRRWVKERGDDILAVFRKA